MTFEQERDEAALEEVEFHGCVTGDCPHIKQEECFKAMFREGANWSHIYNKKEVLNCEEMIDVRFALAAHVGACGPIIDCKDCDPSVGHFCPECKSYENISNALHSFDSLLKRIGG